MSDKVIEEWAFHIDGPLPLFVRRASRQEALRDAGIHKVVRRQVTYGPWVAHDSESSTGADLRDDVRLKVLNVVFRAFDVGNVMDCGLVADEIIQLVRTSGTYSTAASSTEAIDRAARVAAQAYWSSDASGEPPSIARLHRQWRDVVRAVISSLGKEAT